MGLISPDLSGIYDGATPTASAWLNPFNTITAAINGGLDNSNIAASAGIDVTKLGSSAWTSHSATLAGFSGTPTQSNVYIQIGKIVILFWKISGTSNATTFTASLPVAAKSSRNHAGLLATDNGSGANNSGVATTTASSTTATMQPTAVLGAGAWTASGTKGIEGIMVYETS